MDDIITGVKEGIAEAIKQNIRANTVLINSKFAKMPESHVPYVIRETYKIDGDVDHVSEYKNLLRLPPMVFGLKVFFTNELPDEYAFALCEGQVQDEYDRLKAENYELREQLEQIKSILGWEE